MPPFPQDTNTRATNPNDGFGRLADTYLLLEWLAFGASLHKARLAHIDALASCSKILLLGDGDGRFLQALLKHNHHAHITSLDSSPGMLAKARKRLKETERKRVRFVQEDARAFAYPSHTYDACTTLFFLDCFSTAEVTGLVKALSNAMTPGGLWLHADFEIPEAGWRRLRARVWLRMLYTFFSQSTHLDTRTLPPSRRLLLQHGWSEQRTLTLQAGLLRSSVFCRTSSGSTNQVRDRTPYPGP